MLQSLVVDGVIAGVGGVVIFLPQIFVLFLFIEPVYGAAVAGWTLFAMHFIGAAVAMPLAWIVNRVILGARPLPFILEMPDYRVPLVRNLGSEVDEESGGLRATMAAERWASGPRAGQPVYTIPVVIGVMVFFALCMQCGATVAVIARELNWRWATASFVSMTALAWLAAVVVYQDGSRL